MKNVEYKDSKRRCRVLARHAGLIAATTAATASGNNGNHNSQVALLARQNTWQLSVQDLLQQHQARYTQSIKSELTEEWISSNQETIRTVLQDEAAVADGKSTFETKHCRSTTKRWTTAADTACSGCCALSSKLAFHHFLSSRRRHRHGAPACGFFAAVDATHLESIVRLSPSSPSPISPSTTTSTTVPPPPPAVVFARTWV
jgi:hypothetical protein